MIQYHYQDDYGENLIDCVREMLKEPSTAVSTQEIRILNPQDYFVILDETGIDKKIEYLFDDDILSFSPPQAWKRLFKQFPQNQQSQIQNRVYFGQMHQNVEHGLGKIFSTTSTEMFEGFFFLGNKHGPGRLVLKNGQIVDGIWFNGKLRVGIFYDLSGRKYFQIKDPEILMPLVRQQKNYYGPLVNGMREGIGRFQWKDGTHYIGNFKNDKMEGFGQMKYIDDKKYIGYWVNNKFEGFGHFEWPNGQVYIGNYKNDKKHGIGMYYDGKVSVIAEFYQGQQIK